MPDSTVKLRKASGGATLTYEGKSYTWKTDGAVVSVPYEFAMTLLGIAGAGYSVDGEDVPVPDPPADLSRTEASPINAKPTAATVKPPAPPAPEEPEEPVKPEPAAGSKNS